MSERADAAGLRDPDALSWQLMALFDSAMAKRLVLGAEAPTTPVVAAAAVLIDAAGRPDPRRPPAPRRWGAGGAA